MSSSDGDLRLSDSSEDDSDEEDEQSDMVMLTMLLESENSRSEQIPMRTSILTGRVYIMELLNNENPNVIYELFRMNKHTFLHLCHTLRTQNYMQDSRGVSVEEKLAMFLYILGHNVRHRACGDRFQHSIETVQRHFRQTLRAMVRFGNTLIRMPENDELPIHVRNNPKHYPWFKDCVGAIDGTHISAWAPAEKSVTYRGRKALITQNVMCICDFNMLFTYVYTGWEGTANDSRVLMDAINRPESNFPILNEGKYFLVDSGYPCTKGFLPPHRGEKYHLNDYRGRGRGPRSPNELFNYRHSSLRNVIERCFAVLKGRFPILKLMPRYKPFRQANIVTACCALHNFIRIWSADDTLFHEWQDENRTTDTIRSESDSTSAGHQMQFSEANTRAMIHFRDQLTYQMWINYAMEDEDE